MSEENRASVGQYLRQEREKKGVSLESVAQVTRITLEQLQALERDEFHAIAAPVFTRGFLRNYASFLGLDPQEVMARYENQVDFVQGSAKIIKASPKAQPAAPPRENGGIFRYLLIFLLLVVAGAGFYFFQKEPSAPPRSAPLAVTPPPAPSPAALPPASSLSPGKPASAGMVTPGKELKEAGQPLSSPIFKPGKEAQQEAKAGMPAVAEEKPKERRHVLKVKAAEKTWMRVKPDEDPVLDVLLQPGETVSWTARRRLDVTVGNAGGIEVFFNGASQGKPGKPGEVVHLVFPPENKPAVPSSPEPKPSAPGLMKPAPQTEFPQDLGIKP